MFVARSSERFKEQLDCHSIWSIVRLLHGCRSGEVAVRRMWEGGGYVRGVRVYVVCVHACGRLGVRVCDSCACMGM